MKNVIRPSGSRRMLVMWTGRPPPSCDLLDGTVLGDEAFLLRYYGPSDAEDRLLLVNLGTDKVICPMPEPLLAPPLGCEWAIRWSSEDVIYGGLGTPALLMHDHWKLLGESALWLGPEERDHG